jgi:hypothetical protein
MALGLLGPSGLAGSACCEESSAGGDGAAGGRGSFFWFWSATQCCSDPAPEPEETEEGPNNAPVKMSTKAVTDTAILYMLLFLLATVGLLLYVAYIAQVLALS